MRHALALASLALLFACSEPAPDPAPAEPPAAEPTPDPAAEQAALDAATAAAQRYGGELKGRLQSAMQEGGPPTAITVCSEHAQALSATVSSETGVQVGRGTLRLRNPDNAAPDWVQAWLTATGERAAEGVSGFKRVETTADGAKVARLLEPLPVEAVCLTCHGAPDALAPGVADLLAERYPADQATGYAVGDLRGVLWAEAPLSN